MKPEDTKILEMLFKDAERRFHSGDSAEDSLKVHMFNKGLKQALDVVTRYAEGGYPPAFLSRLEEIYSGK
jgi:hypothetical protein